MTDQESLPSRTIMAFRHPGDEWDGYAALIVAAYVDHTLSTVKEHDARKVTISFTPFPRPPSVAETEQQIRDLLNKI